MSLKIIIGDFSLSERGVLSKTGFVAVRRLNDGSIIGVLDQRFTWELTGNTPFRSGTHRFFYGKGVYSLDNVTEIMCRWDGRTLPEGEWIEYQGPLGNYKKEQKKRLRYLLQELNKKDALKRGTKKNQ